MITEDTHDWHGCQLLLNWTHRVSNDSVQLPRNRVDHCRGYLIHPLILMAPAGKKETFRLRAAQCWACAAIDLAEQAWGPGRST